MDAGEKNLGPAAEELRAELARRTGTRAGEWHLVLKARYGMLAAFEVLRARGGEGSVVTQPFTCCTAVDPIVSADLRPVYAELSPRSLAVDPEGLSLPGDVRAVVLQNTCGIIHEGDASALARAAHGVGAILVEDCAHCVGRMARDAAGEPLADVSVHSFGVEKMLRTSFGGAIWVNPRMADASLRAALESALDALPEMTPSRQRATRLYRNEIRVLNRLPRPAARALRGALERMGLFEPAVTDAERSGRVSGTPARPDEWVCSRALEALSSEDAQLAQRSEAVRAYTRALAASPLGTGAASPLEVPRALVPEFSQPLLTYPVFLADADGADRAVAEVLAAGFYARPWYRPLLYPGALDAGAYELPAAGALPLTERCSAGAVMLPTDVSPEDAERIAGIVVRVAGR